jgi:hypothetical protein
MRRDTHKVKVSVLLVARSRNPLYFKLETTVFAHRREKSRARLLSDIAGSRH